MSHASGISGIQPAGNDLCYVGGPIIVILNKPGAPPTSQILDNVLVRAVLPVCLIMFLVMVKYVTCRGVNFRLARDTNWPSANS